VVSEEVLAALDALLWLRTGDRAAAYLQCTQPTVSRHSRRCLKVFGLAIAKQSGEWCLRGDQTLIDLERGVHQLLRWRQGRGLRLDGQHWSSCTACRPSSPRRGRRATTTISNTTGRRSYCARA
jgi:hypothetical protein